MKRLLLCLLCLTPIAVRADPVRAHYAAYAAGLNVMVMDASLDVSPQRYRLDLDFRTAGTVAVFSSTRIASRVEGGFDHGAAAPIQFYSAGTLRGEKRLTRLEYRDRQPVVAQLSPPTESEREPVPPDLQRNTVDTLSAMAQLIGQVNQTGKCDGTLRTFDGRRMAEMRAWTVGPDDLEPTRRSTFAGKALHCEFQGRQLAGFKLDESHEAQQRLQRGGAWFAAITPGGPLVPVRISFHTRWFGDAVMYVDARD